MWRRLRDSNPLASPTSPLRLFAWDCTQEYWFFCSKLINKCLYSWITQADRHFRSWNNHVEMEVSHYVRGSKTILNPGFHAVDSGFQLLDSSLWSLPVELGFWIPIVCGIPDSLSCIPDYKAQKIFFQIPEIGFPYVGWKVRSHLR